MDRAPSAAMSFDGSISDAASRLPRLQNYQSFGPSQIVKRADGLTQDETPEHHDDDPSIARNDDEFALTERQRSQINSA